MFFYYTPHPSGWRLAWTWPARHLNRGWPGLFNTLVYQEVLAKLHVVMPKPFPASFFDIRIRVCLGKDNYDWLLNFLEKFTLKLFSVQFNSILFSIRLSLHCDVESWRTKTFTDGDQFIKLFVPGALVLHPGYWPAAKRSAAHVAITRLGSPIFPANAPLLSSVSLLQYYDLISGRSMCLPPVCSVNEYVCQWITTGKSLSNRCWLSQLWNKNPSCSLPFLRPAYYSSC